MFGRVKRALSRALGKTYTVPLLIALAQTNNTSTSTGANAGSFDYNSITQIVVAVIPLFVLIAVLKMLFQSFREMS